MKITRRDVVASAGTAALLAALPARALPKEEKKMYGLIGQMKALPGARDKLVAILLEGVSGMPGCLSYVVANDPLDSNSIWITEVWESQELHRMSLSLPSVQNAIQQGKPLIAGFGERFVTTPVGGHGLVR
ncbi:putative quinol monooxygenase [Pseudoduganella sp. GCM10020061]|uniref:putative quinol monooxygenase n=1 Tax=Pseudoduganella sp. GCM10020061 TaxID=3317345 RepID=UPI0036258E35